MKVYLLLLLALFSTGCTHYSISNHQLLEEPLHAEGHSHKNLQLYPLKIDASMSCYKRRVGQNIKTSCSNKGRLNSIVKHFKQRGFQVVPDSGETTASISVTKDSINGFVERVTGFFNIITLGLSPLYHYDDYTVTFKDPKAKIDISQTVRVSSKTSWFSLFFSNPKDLEKAELNRRAEENLIRLVLDEASITANTVGI